MKLACQTITWGNTITENLPEILRAVAAAGYSGVEIGFRHLAPRAAAEVRDLAAAEGLTLAATHLGGNLEDTAQAEHEQGMIGAVLDYAAVTGTRLVMYSGLRYQDDDQLARDIAMINRAARLCAERGVALLYHNHNWEFENGHRVMNALLDNAVPELGLCPDVGWVARGGVDVLPWLKRVADRIGAVHFKDFGSLDEGVHTVELGEGLVPLADVADWLKSRDTDLWVIAEQDTSALPPAEAARRNAAFLKHVFGQS
ncbi:MAG: sugar phosphate isomerase/epimerase [Lentisphaerae bacterium]|nr:sugar phosphate isomerase/epimerase [Lentisphaerota bacterium]